MSTFILDIVYLLAELLKPRRLRGGSNWEGPPSYILGYVTLGVVGVLVAALVLRLREGQPGHQHYPEAVVASNGHECAAIGRSILERNGSAVDAAIAVLFCEGVSCAQCLGLSGGFLATIYDARTGRVSVLNARERAPAATREDMFTTAHSAAVGGLAVAVPGELRGYGELYQRFGRLPWRDLVKPTADLCRHGHYITEYMARTLLSHSDQIKSEPSMREVYVDAETGEVWREGDVITLPTLAATLDIIAEEGPEAMHNGTLTALLVRDIREYGGVITADDLRNYRVEWKEPIRVQLDDDHLLYTSPLPGSGAVLAFILNMQKDWVDESSPPGSALYWHRIIETFKFAYGERTKLGDPSRSNVDYDISQLERNLSLPEFAVLQRLRISDTQTSNQYEHYGAQFEGATDHGTAHSVVVAPDGSAVSVTSTVNYIWGCKRISRSLGIVLNNEMDDFAIPNRTSGYGLPPSPANFLGPGLNPLSSMVPSVVLDKKGNAVLVVGGAGGTKITTQVALMVRHMILENNDLHYAMVRPRLHHQLMPMEVMFEEDFDPEILSSLRKFGHVIPPFRPSAGFCAMVSAARDTQGYLVAEYDKRRPGSVDGF